MKLLFPIALIITSFIGCKQAPQTTVVASDMKEDIPWMHLDLMNDSIPGISLERAYEEFGLEEGGENIIVAVMDQPIDLNHEDLKDVIYTNVQELSNNDIDDDKNGYIDDVNGWNFLGYGKYNYERYTSPVYIRIIRQYAEKFEGKTVKDIQPDNLKFFESYQNAIAKQKEEAENEELYMQYVSDAEKEHYTFIKAFSDRLMGRLDFTHGFLDSLETKNEKEKELVKIAKRNIDWGYSFDYTYADDGNTVINFYTVNNIDYNERANIGDDPYDYETVGYGNGNVDATSEHTHGTQVTGLIAAKRNNGLGIRGISNNIKIMPLIVLPELGSMNDKDLANAVRYAVDNGAKIINFSGNKDESENPALLFSALKYAENNGVLVITPSGNEVLDTDKPENTMYFTDKFEGDSVTNLIRVGSTTKLLGSSLLSYFSNYGKNSVEVFAPGEDIKTTDPRRSRYKVNSGTSLSTAITSGVAALVWSHYPELSFKQVKRILMDSGTEYEGLLVTVGENDSIPFRELSKSGKVLNAYNAIKMAKEMDSINKE